MASIIDPTDDSIITDGLQGCNASDEALQAARRSAAERDSAVVLQDDDGNWMVNTDGTCEQARWTDGTGWLTEAVTHYTTKGPVRGTCGHEHKTVDTAYRCLERDRSGCRGQGGYSDRSIVDSNGDRVDPDVVHELERRA